jgi:hypothetical protein
MPVDTGRPDHHAIDSELIFRYGDNTEKAASGTTVSALSDISPAGGKDRQRHNGQQSAEIFVLGKVPAPRSRVFK